MDQFNNIYQEENIDIKTLIVKFFSYWHLFALTIMISLIIAFLFTTLTFGQFKDDISVVQFSAEFLVDKQISLRKFKQFNTHTIFMSEYKKFFADEKIEYLPTIILYNNGDEILRVHGGMSLTLPEDTVKQLQKNIDELLQNKF